MSYRVRSLYLIPTDKTEFATAAMTRQAMHHQAWYQWKIGMNKTFTLNNPITEVLHSTQISSWFASNPAGGNDNTYWFWNNTHADVNSLLGSIQPDEIRMTYVDADKFPNQQIGGNVGHAVMDRDDLLAMAGRNPDRPNICVEAGGCAHELGHTFGLVHPVGDPDWAIALMGIGYAIYPDSILLPADLNILNASHFISVLPPKYPPGGLCKFNNRIPPPIPRPPRHAYDEENKTNKFVPGN